MTRNRFVDRTWPLISSLRDSDLYNKELLSDLSLTPNSGSPRNNDPLAPFRVGNRFFIDTGRRSFDGSVPSIREVAPPLGADEDF